DGGKPCDTHTPRLATRRFRARRFSSPSTCWIRTRVKPTRCTPCGRASRTRTSATVRVREARPHGVHLVGFTRVRIQHVLGEEKRRARNLRVANLGVCVSHGFPPSGGSRSEE